MIPANVSPILDHLWQSTAFAGLMAAVAFGLRKNRAAVRFWFWLAASLKFLVPFAFLVELGRLISWRPAPTIFQPAQWTAIQDVGQTVFTPSSAITLSPGTAIHASSMWWAWLAGLWAVGTLFVAVRWARQWWGVRALVRRAAPVDLGLLIPTVTAPATLEPGVFGVFRPVLFLPGGITERMTPEQMRALVEHELCHVRRRDNLWAALHVAVEAIFWFHPAVWWLGARMVEEREACCDEAVLCAGAAADVYAASVLEVCRFYAAPPTPAISGITGADLKNRVLAIASRDFGRKLSPASRLLLFGLGCSLLAAPVSAGLLLKSSPVSARSTAPAEVGPPPPPQTQGTPAPAAASGVDVTWTRISSAEYSVRIGVTLPGSEFVRASQSEKENAQFDFIGEVKDAYGTTVTNLSNLETFKITGAGAVDPAHVPVFHFDDVKLLPGNYTLKVLARDDDTGRVGIYVKQFTIPSAPALPLEAPAAPQQQAPRQPMQTALPRDAFDLAAMAAAQVPAPTFGAVSIKPVAPGGVFRMPGPGWSPIEPGGAYRNPTATLAGLIAAAYALKFPSVEMLGAPDWAQSVRFDVEATPPTDFPNLPTEQNEARVELMLQAMLADRFHLKAHRETHSGEVYKLELEPGGLKIKPTAQATADAQPAIAIKAGYADGHANVQAQAVPISRLAGILGNQLQRKVDDDTGIVGLLTFDFDFYPPDGVSSSRDPAFMASEIAALRSQLGLRLEKTTGAVEVLVIDHVEQPTANN